MPPDMWIPASPLTSCHDNLPAQSSLEVSARVPRRHQLAPSPVLPPAAILNVSPALMMRRWRRRKTRHEVPSIVRTCRPVSPVPRPTRILHNGRRAVGTIRRHNGLIERLLSPLMPVADTTRIPAHADAPSTLYTSTTDGCVTIRDVLVPHLRPRRSTIDATSPAPPLPCSYYVSSDRGFRESAPGGGGRYHPARVAIVAMRDGSHFKKSVGALPRRRWRGLDWIVRCLLYGAWRRVQGTGVTRNRYKFREGLVLGVCGRKRR
ncbi:hypothetical protein C8J57DRAFT_1246878 [Mycena rebaudengoi]|nr:hypothetical protein C8J57DRAFT_1246878 [Mycena rebaudengoi]